MRVIVRKTVRLMAGISIFALIVLFFSSGIAPPGTAGAVLRHNQENDIDASPLFYSEVENMSELEEGIKDISDLKQAIEKDRSR